MLRMYMCLKNEMSERNKIKKEELPEKSITAIK